MNIQVEKKDISRVGHTSMDVQGYLVALCSEETAGIDYIILRNVLKCFGEDYEIVAEYKDELEHDVAYATNLPWSLYEETVFEKESINEAREHLEFMGKLIVGDWSAGCFGNTLRIENNGIRLAARGDEELERIIFDVENKTVSVKVKHPILPEDTPRTVDLSDATVFFEELRNDVEILLGRPEAITPNADRTVFEISGIKVFKRGIHSGFHMDGWTVSCIGRRFIINNNGMKLAVRGDEELEKIIFDVENKTVSVRVKEPKLSAKAPRTADLSGATELFEELRKDIEKLLTEKGDFKSVTPNADRTVFEIS